NLAVVSQREVVLAEAARDEAEAALQSVEADRDLAKLKLEVTTVRAPFDGMISQIMVSVGEIVTDRVEIARLISPDPLYVDFYVEEAVGLLFQRLPRNGQGRPGAEGEIPVLLGVRDEPGFPHRGRLDFVAPVMEPVRETAVHCRAVVPN